MNLNTRAGKEAFQRTFLRKAGQNFEAVKRLMDLLPTVGFYIKDSHDRIVTLNKRNCEISALTDEFDAIGRKSSDLFPEPIARECLARDAKVRAADRPTENGVNFAPVDRSPTPTIYSVFPLHDAKGRLIGTMCGFYYTKKGDVKPPDRQRLQPALTLLGQSLNRTVPLRDLAASCNLSVTHFRRLFLTIFRETPAKYALRLRLNQARQELETSDRPIVDIALETGFYDQSHFIRSFRRIYKVSPNAYRLRHRRYGS